MLKEKKTKEKKKQRVEKLKNPLVSLVITFYLKTSFKRDNEKIKIINYSLAKMNIFFCFSKA